MENKNRSSTNQKKIFKMFEKQIKESFLDLGYFVELVLSTNSDAVVTSNDLVYSKEIVKHLKTNEYKCSLHQNAQSSNVSDVIYLERSLNELFKQMCETSGTPSYITGVEFYNVRQYSKEITELKQEIEQLTANYTEQFKVDTDFIMEQLNQKIEAEEKKIEQIVKRPDIYEIIEERKAGLRKILKKYRNIDVSDQVLLTMSILNDDEITHLLTYEFVTIQEQLQQEIRKPSKLNRTNFDVLPTIFYPYESKIGRLLFFFNDDPKHYGYVLAGIEPNEEYQEKFSLFQKNYGSNPVYIREEIPELVKNLIEDAKKEIIFVVPWVTAGIQNVNTHKNYYKELAEAAKHIPIHIYYGFDGNSDSAGKSNEQIQSDLNERKENTEAKLKQFVLSLDEKSRENIICHYGYLHIKALIIDSKVMIIGSNNMLSNIPRKPKLNNFEPYTQGEVMMVTRDSMAIRAVERYCKGIKVSKLI